MANLTIAVDAEVLKRARQRALEEGTSVNAVLRSHLEAYAGRDRVAQAIAEVIELARSSSGGSGPGGRKWTRDELHDRKWARHNPDDL